jgi:hypothetical protein
MPRHFKVFLASPSDVPAERQAVFEIVSRLPYDPLLRGKVTTEIVAWDGPFSSVPLLATVDPQSSVALGLSAPSECDLVVVIIHARLGTDLPEKYDRDGQPVTGTEWEYEEATAAHALVGRPEVVVYRRVVSSSAERPAAISPDAHDQAARVESFFVRLQARGVGFNAFQSVEGFAQHFSDHLRSFVARSVAIPDARSMVANWLSSGGAAPTTEVLTAFASDPVQEPHLRIMVVDRLAEKESSFPTTHPTELADLARLLMGIPHDDLGKAGLKLAKRCVGVGAMAIADFTTGAGNRRWEVKSATVAVVAGYNDLEVLDVYGAIGRSLSYWRPVQTMAEHLVRLSPNFSDEQRAEAIRVLEELLSNPRQSEKQQALLPVAIARIRQGISTSHV